jgi:putative resolvase
MNRKKLSCWAEEQGVHYRTALSWVRDGTMPIPVERTPGGHIRVIESGVVADSSRRIVLYGRVSSSDQKGDLDRQMERLRTFAAASGFTDVEPVEEVGSGLNGHRKKLTRLLSDPSVSLIVVEHRDRLSRFGFEYIESALAAQNRRIIIMESGDHKLDLVQDFIDVVTSMCARIYGRRSAKNKAKRALAAAEESV